MSCWIGRSPCTATAWGARGVVAGPARQRQKMAADALAVGVVLSGDFGDQAEASSLAAALRNAIARRSPMGTVVHSDRGSQGGSARTPLSARWPTTNWSARWAG